MRFYAVAHRNYHVQIIIIQHTRHFSDALLSNCQVFLDSCFRF